MWSVIDGPFSHYNAAAQVLASEDGARFVWQCDLLPDELAALVAEMMERGISTIKHTLETAGTKLAGFSPLAQPEIFMEVVRPGAAAGRDGAEAI